MAPAISCTVVSLSAQHDHDPDHDHGREGRTKVEARSGTESRAKGAKGAKGPR
jgi:hypothetical protein